MRTVRVNSAGSWIGAIALALVTCSTTSQAATIVITPTTLGSLVVGTPVSVQLVPADLCPDGELTPTFSGALPAGLTINLTNGLVSGTPTTAGSYSWTVSLTDTCGNSGSQAFTGTVATAVPTAPGWVLGALAALLLLVGARRLRPRTA